MYSKEFIARVKEVYPDSPTIIELAEKGSDLLGRYLDDCSNSTLSPRMVLESTYEELVEWARKAQARIDLYSDYSRGVCFDTKDLENKMCPILYMQNNGDKDKMSFEDVICKEVGYVGYFPGCKKWNCKGECWKKYYMLKDGVNNFS